MITFDNLEAATAFVLSIKQNHNWSIKPSSGITSSPDYLSGELDTGVMFHHPYRQDQESFIRVE